MFVGRTDAQFIQHKFIIIIIHVVMAKNIWIIEIQKIAGSSGSAAHIFLEKWLLLHVRFLGEQKLWGCVVLIDDKFDRIFYNIKIYISINNINIYYLV